MSETIIVNKNNLEKTIEAIKQSGPNKFHVLADFDRTLTRAFVNGKYIPSLMSILRDEGYLTPEYSTKANELFEHYHPIETNPLLPSAEKKQAMHEWYCKHFELLITSKLNKIDLAKAITSENLQLREGAKDFFAFLKTKQIPLVIMSASGAGMEMISQFLQTNNCWSENIHVISNELKWDANGYAIDVKEPIIHSHNKHETFIKDFPFFDKFVNRKNVLLIGDNQEDVGMIEGFEYSNLVKVGFLNNHISEYLEVFKKTFDVVITDDGDMNYLNQLLNNFFA